MRTFTFSLINARLAYLITITRSDETVIRITTDTHSVSVSDGSSPGTTWVAAAGIELSDMTDTNDGTLSNLTFQVGTETDGTFDPYEIDLGLFEDAHVLIEITNAANPLTKDFEFEGRMNGSADYDLEGNVSFEVLNLFGTPRDIFVRKYTIEDNVDFGDPRRSKIPTFPSIDATSDDLHDVSRLEVLALGERRRFRFASAGNPSDYHNVYLEVTTAGTTGAGTPTISDTVSATSTDGSVTFTTRNAYARSFQVASLIDTRHITITVTEPRATVTTWYAPGRLIMRSGFCKNRVSVIDAWNGTSQIELVEPFGNLLTVGDWGEIAPDYDQTLEMADSKYGTALGLLADGGPNNYRGFPHLTGARISTSTFVPGTTVVPGPTDDPSAPPSGDGGSGGGIAVEFLGGAD
jgi:hypothetical protein